MKLVDRYSITNLCLNKTLLVRRRDDHDHYLTRFVLCYAFADYVSVLQRTKTAVIPNRDSRHLLENVSFSFFGGLDASQVSHEVMQIVVIPQVANYCGV